MRWRARAATPHRAGVIDPLADQPRQPVVAAAVELEPSSCSFSSSMNGRNRSRCKPVLVEPVRRAVRGRDDDRAGLEQGAEQPFEDHRVGDVVDLELVETQQRRLGGEVGGDLGDRLVGAGAALALDAGMDVEHEGMEMHPPLVARPAPRRKTNPSASICRARPDPRDRCRAAATAPRSPRPRRPSQPRRAGRPACSRAARRGDVQPGDRAKLRRIGADRAPPARSRYSATGPALGGRRRSACGGTERSSGIGGRTGRRSAARAAIRRGPRSRSNSAGGNPKCNRRAPVIPPGPAPRRSGDGLPRALPANSRLNSHSRRRRPARDRHGRHRSACRRAPA